MVKLTFYGGVNEIGGNKILLEDGDERLFLDFGFPYKRHKLFYEEYLKPRGGAGLLDPLTMGLLPPLEGAYRSEIAAPDLWQRFQGTPRYRKLEHIDGVLLSHAHLDHSGHISFLKPDIPVFSTAATALLTKAIQDSGKSDFDQQVCYFSPTEWGCPTGLKQTAVLTGAGPKQVRQFCVGDLDPKDLSQETHQFWSSGFWEKSPRQKGLASCALADHKGSRFKLRCFPVDHSIPGACAWGIETNSGWVVYSGDLRLHGKRSELTKAFIQEAAALRPKAFILEGTNVLRSRNTSEQEVYENALNVIKGAKSLVIADFSARDMDRLLTFAQVASETGRKLAILPRDAYLLKTLRLLDSRMPDVASDGRLVVYQDTMASRSPALWLRNIFSEFDRQTVLAEDVSREQDRFILCFSFFDLGELPSIRPAPGSIYVFSSSEPHDEEQEIDFQRLHNWLKHFGIRPVGLPLKEMDEWRIPESERGLHASGHACGPDLMEIAREVKPNVFMPVHSEHPEIYVNWLKDTGITVSLPQAGGTIEM